MGNPEYSAYEEEDEVYGEQLALSARVVTENTLPPDIVAYHRQILEYWGITLQALGQPSLPLIIHPDDDEAFYRDLYA